MLIVEMTETLPSERSPKRSDYYDNSVLAGRLRILLAEVLLPALIVLVISNFIFRTPWLLDRMDRYRPGRRGLSTTTHVERQMLHIEAEARLNRRKAKAVFIGTSSVVNGIDVESIEAVWRKTDFNFKPVNYGLTGLMAYELPFLKDQLITSEVEVIIFLYNTFCFSDVIHPQAASIRFDVYESIRNPVWSKAKPQHFFKGFWGDMFFVIRYRGVVKELLYRLVKGRLVELPHGYDFNPGQPRRGKRPRRVERPARGHWLRQAYVTSDTDHDTISYRGFRRFLDLAKSAGIKVVIAAMPVPDFARSNRYRIGVNHDRIDSRVEEIARAYGAPFISRSRIRAIEKEDSLFWDRIHLHDTGRTLYSVWLAETLPTLIRSN